jgi:hypothetical protein
MSADFTPYSSDYPNLFQLEAATTIILLVFLALIILDIFSQRWLMLLQLITTLTPFG